MKKHLLLASALLFGASLFAQFTQDNEPAIGSGATLYLLDSNAVNYADVNGSGVTWDYSATQGYAGEQRLVTVLEASGTNDGTSFPSAEKAIAIENFLVNYISSTATERISHGFVFSEPQAGDVLAIFDVDQATAMNYPFAFESSLEDDFEGSLTTGFGDGDLSGTTEASVDGTGTLQLANGVTYDNVLRYRIDESIEASINLFGAPTIINLVRTQFEYYNFDESDLPLFIHSDVAITSDLLNQEFSVVLSSEEAEELSTENLASFETLDVYPNPATDVITIKMDNVINGTTATLHDAMGRVIKTIDVKNNVTTLPVSGLNRGVYLLNFKNGAISETKRIIIK